MPDWLPAAPADWPSHGACTSGVSSKGKVATQPAPRATVPVWTSRRQGLHSTPAPHARTAHFPGRNAGATGQRWQAPDVNWGETRRARCCSTAAGVPAPWTLRPHRCRQLGHAELADSMTRAASRTTAPTRAQTTHTHNVCTQESAQITACEAGNGPGLAPTTALPVKGGTRRWPPACSTAGAAQPQCLLHGRHGRQHAQYHHVVAMPHSLLAAALNHAQRLCAGRVAEKWHDIEIRGVIC